MATFLYYGDFQHYGYCENWIASALDRNGHHCVRMSRLHGITDRTYGRTNAIATTVKRHHADCLLVSKAPDLLASEMEEIRNHTGCKIVMWTFDWMRHPSNWKWYGPQAKVADICFQTDGYGEQEGYEKAGIRRVELHQGCVPGLHDLPQSVLPRGPINQMGLDIVFIGSMYTERRQELFSRLSKYTAFRYFGKPGQQLWGNEFARVCYGSKIVIGDNFVNDVAGYWSDRVYLTLGCGGFFLTSYVPGLELEFENHRHLVWYHDFDEMCRLIDYYLPRESERRAIALEGYRLVHREHTYDRRIQKMTEELSKL